MTASFRPGFVAAAALALGVAFVLPRDARACGGTFCDGGPAATPVDQTGENILFVMDGEFTEAHIQIQYSGNAHRFAWIVPMPVIPTVHVGSQGLFTALLNATTPTYQLNFTADQCASDSPGCGASEDFADSPGFGSGGGSGTGGASGGGPTVVLQKAVGAFDVTVLQGGTAKEVQTWLDDNGYGSTADTPALLGDYVKENYVFVAIKLEPGAGVNEIHPLVLRYASKMPCVPIRLTRVAAVDNMNIRAFFLGQSRVYPENYALVDVNEDKLDWANGAPNYDQVVSAAIDEAPGHHGFVVEYAGTPFVVPSFSFWNDAWAGPDFAKTKPERTVEILTNVGLMSCSGVCTFSHPLLQPLLEEYLPVPAGSGLTEDAWYEDLANSADRIDAAKWDGAAFEKDYTERIVDPGRHAAEALGNARFLTRLLTRLSPAEMTLDPTFVERPDLHEPNVGVAHVASEHIRCDAPAIASGRSLDKVVVPTGTWPSFDDMPFARRVRTVPAKGEPEVVVDNGAKIEASLERWNDANEVGAAGGCSTRSGRGSTSTGLGIALGLLVLRRRRRR